VNLGAEFAAVTTANPVVLTPDGQGAITNVKRAGSTLEFTLDRLDTYTVVVLGS
jgi:hypothetical protein